MKKSVFCARCGKREGMGKCHEKIKHKDNTFHLCVECSQIAYKIKDAVIDSDDARADALARTFSSRPDTANETLSNWFAEYKARIDYTP